MTISSKPVYSMDQSSRKRRLEKILQRSRVRRKFGGGAEREREMREMVNRDVNSTADPLGWSIKVYLILKCKLRAPGVFRM
jgi:hypothetical protein